MAKSTGSKQAKLLNKKRSQPVTGLLRYYQPVKKTKPLLNSEDDLQNSTIIISTESEDDRNDLSAPSDNAVDWVEILPRAPPIVLNMWTEKYKPSCDESWIGDRHPVSVLMDFITKPRRPNQCNIDDEDDLIQCNDTNVNAVLLTGNHGWGKTCLVHAIANKCNMRVLEMNSSCRRSGRTITSQLREATQTHLLNVKSDKSAVKSDISKFFIRKPTVDSSSSETTSQSSATGSQFDKFRQQIILFDDVDVIFEGKEDSKDEELDTGFWRSLKQLIRDSKVPVILTATHCRDHIIKSKLNDMKILTVDITKPNLLEVRNHLTSICAKEFDASSNIDMTTNEATSRIDHLIKSVAFDVRACINQLNFTGECFFAPISVPKTTPRSGRRGKKRGRSKRSQPKPDPLKLYREASLISDINYISSSTEIDLSNLVLECNCRTKFPQRSLYQQIDEMSSTDSLKSILATTESFIDDSFSSTNARPSLLTSQVNQVVDILPFFTIICQTEAEKNNNRDICLPERQKTRRRSRLQGLPYFEAIESFRLNDVYRDELCSAFQYFCDSFGFYDSDATDLDE